MPDEATWLAIERAYCDSSEPLTSIAARFGIAPGSIHKRADTYGWPRRRSHRARKTEIATARRLEAARNHVALQIYDRMSQRLAHMETGTAAGGEGPAADDPDDRMLTQLIKQFEKLTGLDGISQRERGAGKACGGSQSRAATRDKSTGRDKSADREQQSAPLDAERLRQDIIQRLERLHADRARKGDAG